MKRFICTICGYIHEGDVPPEICPICKAGTDKFKEMKLHSLPSQFINAPGIEESPVNIECKVEQIIPLGSHDMFLGRVMGVTVDDQYMDENGKFHLNDSGLISYSHGEYFELGKKYGKFGHSVQKKIKG